MSARRANWQEQLRAKKGAGASSVWNLSATSDAINVNVNSDPELERFGRFGYLKGLMITTPPTSLPWSMSSEYNCLQPSARAEATTALSQ